jgi:hypothetical protein
VTQLPWTPVVYLPVDLTVRFGADVLTADNPAPWCQRKAAGLLGPDAAPKQVSRLARCLEEYAAHFRSEELPATAALFFWPDFTRIPPRAMAKVYLVGEDPVIGPMTLAMAREIYGPDELSFGETEMTETEVPAPMVEILTPPALRRPVAGRQRHHRAAASLHIRPSPARGWRRCRARCCCATCPRLAGRRGQGTRPSRSA